MNRITNNIKNHSNWLSYYTSKYFNKNQSSFTFKLRNKVAIKVPRRLVPTYKELFFDETYTKGFPMRIELNEEANIIDIGANVGYFSLFMGAMFPKANIYAFEPMPMNFALLQQYKNENPKLNLIINNQAISKNIGAITLNYNANDSYSTAASIHDTHDQKDTIEVNTTTLEHFIKENSLAKIDFLKLDCEGSEYDILYNCPDEILNHIQYLAIETHDGHAENENSASLITFLKKHQFKINVLRSKIWAWK
jgi:FkbM family methyltransferase